MYIILHRTSEMCKFCRNEYRLFNFDLFFLIYDIPAVQQLKCRNMKDEETCFCNGGGDAYLLETWSDFSSLQYSIITQVPSNSTCTSSYLPVPTYKFFCFTSGERRWTDTWCYVIHKIFVQVPMVLPYVLYHYLLPALVQLSAKKQLNRYRRSVQESIS